MVLLPGNPPLLQPSPGRCACVYIYVCVRVSVCVHCAREKTNVRVNLYVRACVRVRKCVHTRVFPHSERVN